MSRLPSLLFLFLLILIINAIIFFFGFENSLDQNSFNYSWIIKTMILSILKVQFFITIGIVLYNHFKSFILCWNDKTCVNFNKKIWYGGLFIFSILKIICSTLDGNIILFWFIHGWKIIKDIFMSNDITLGVFYSMCAQMDMCKEF
jgi:hypothetical protein